jgi:redox-sensitive bicupin YhaK (pirin superfamily)
MSDPVLALAPIGFPWSTPDPFLFCAHHEDAYPAGDERLGPAASLAGRDLGQDFEGKDGWRMYHGQVVPGFPQHPHRGFETVTIVREGLIDHSDSLGATARFGHGDVQWLTAGRGIVHSEMFPLLDRAGPNPLELFQIWLNLPHARKLVDPHFSMFWRDAIPRVRTADPAGREAEVLVVAGALGTVQPPRPPPASWAARPEAEVAIWAIRLAPLATFTLPPSHAGVNRALYLFRGGPLRAGPHELPPRSRADLRADATVALANGPGESELLLLQGRPLGEPVVQHGPFVMSTPDEIRQALADYQRTRFGGWPFASDGPVHPRDARRFARHPDGRVERPG